MLTLWHNGVGWDLHNDVLSPTAMMTMTAQLPQPDHPATPAERLADLTALIQQAPDLAPLLEGLIESLRADA